MGIAVLGERAEFRALQRGGGEKRVLGGGIEVRGQEQPRFQFLEHGLANEGGGLADLVRDRGLRNRCVAQGLQGRAQRTLGGHRRRTDGQRADDLALGAPGGGFALGGKGERCRIRLARRPFHARRARARKGRLGRSGQVGKGRGPSRAGSHGVPHGRAAPPLCLFVSGRGCKMCACSQSELCRGSD